MSEGRMTIVKRDGRTYEIPDMWLAGMCFRRHNALTLTQAIDWWIYQESLAEQEAAR